MSLSDDRFFVYRGDASGVDVVSCLLAERRGEVFRDHGGRTPGPINHQPQASTAGKNLMVDCPAGASCDALTTWCVTPLRPWRPPLRQGSTSCLATLRALDVGCYLPVTVRTTLATGGNYVGTSSPKKGYERVRQGKRPYFVFLGLRNGPLEVQATVDTQTAARLSP
jgi:hypothetical protein